MNAHIHAVAMQQYAEDAGKSDEPWLGWECAYYKKASGELRTWERCGHHPQWETDREYRRVVPHLRIGEFEVPMPLQNDAEMVDIAFSGKPVFLADPVYFSHKGAVHSFAPNYDRAFAHHVLKIGLLHATEANAELHCKALLSLSAPEVEGTK